MIQPIWQRFGYLVWFRSKFLFQGALVLTGAASAWAANPCSSFQTSDSKSKPHRELVWESENLGKAELQPGNLGLKLVLPRAQGARTSSIVTYNLARVRENLGLTDAEVKSLAHKRVLLIGESYGELLPFLEAQKQSGVFIEVVAIDPLYAVAPSGAAQVAPQHIEQLQSVLSAQHRGGGSLMIAGMGERLPLATGSVDRVFSHLVINNLRDSKSNFEISALDPFLRESFRVLKPGGRAVHVTTSLRGRQSQQILESLAWSLGDGYQENARFEPEQMGSIEMTYSSLSGPGYRERNFDTLDLQRFTLHKLGSPSR